MVDLQLDNTQVEVAVTGGVSFYETNSPTKPTFTKGDSAALAIDVDYVGLLSESGTVITREEGDSTDITAWQYSQVVRSMVSGGSLTVSFTMIEAKKAANQTLFFGDESGQTWRLTNPEGMLIVDSVDTADGAGVRFVFPNAKLTSQDDLTLVATDAVGLGVTFTCRPIPGEGAGDVVAYVYRGIVDLSGEEETAEEGDGI